MNDRFVDGVGNVAVQAAVARVELTRLVKIPAKDEAPTFEVSERLVMNVDTLLRMHQALNEVVRQLEEKGVIKKKDSQDSKASSKKSS